AGAGATLWWSGAGGGLRPASRSAAVSAPPPPSPQPPAIPPAAAEVQTVLPALVEAEDVRAAREELDSLVAKGELSIVVASTLKLTLDRYPAFFSFVARKPCADNSDETIRPEDTDPDPYDPVFVISDLLFSEISKNRGASETKFKFITRDYPDETADRKITFIRKDFLRIFIAEIVGNAIDHGDTAKGISVKSSVDDKMQMQLTVENSPKYLQPNANLIPKPGRGLSSIREFCSALGGNALFNHKDGKFAINISLPLSRIAMRFLNKDS
ncbi:MAG: ATP-binding protein, partial [Verrucomicrobiota bacterium]